MATRYALSGYKAQHLALMRAIDTLRKKYAKVSFPKQDVILRLLDGLAVFGDKHFNFFYKGFTSKDDTQTRLVESLTFPPPAVLATILSQISEDLTIIQRAADQRRVDRLVGTLECADNLTFNTLYQARNLVASDPAGQRWADDTTVLTYFEKSHASRVIPYAPVALIGIPLSCLYIEQDFLAIPHEVGHYVYHHRAIDPGHHAANRKYSLDGGDIDLWQEEIFADVFGALVAGPVIAYDFQELSNIFGRNTFLDRTDTHPAPFLRPLIYTYVLRQFLQAFPEWKTSADNLDERWAQLLRERWVEVFLHRRQVAVEWAKEFEGAEDATLQELSALGQVGENNQTWNSDDARYLETVYTSLNALDFTADDLPQPQADVLKVVDKAIAILKDVGKPGWVTDVNTFNTLVEQRNAWEVSERIDSSLQNPALPDPFEPFRAWLHDHWCAPDQTGLIAEVVAEGAALASVRAAEAKGASTMSESTPDAQSSMPELPDDIWHRWVRREKFFGNREPEALPDPVLPGVGGPRIWDKPTNPPVALGVAPGTERELNWMQLWQAGGWTTEPPHVNPPGD